MKTLLLTLDYELYGNGTGYVFTQIIEPTYRILDIVRKYGVKITVFFEVVEYWRLKEEWDKGNKMGYRENPITAMEDQIRMAYQEGHDIQLHIHPQWVDAYYVHGKWNVNFEAWRLGSYEREGKYSLANLLKEGKRTIESIINEIDPNYKCIALRAGGYNIQPSAQIVRAMKETGIYIDSSVYPGGLEKGNLSNYDYSKVLVNIGWWHTGDFLEEKGEEELIELPIVAFPITRWRKYLSIARILSLFRNRESAKETFEAKTGGKRKAYLSKIKFFREKEWQTWDYCLFSASQHGKYLSLINKQLDRDVFVLVGHPKSFVTGRTFEFLLRKTNGKFGFKTISQAEHLFTN